MRPSESLTTEIVLFSKYIVNLYLPIYNGSVLDVNVSVKGFTPGEI
jgi:hypothetical protein